MKIEHIKAMNSTNITWAIRCEFIPVESELRNDDLSEEVDTDRETFRMF